MKRIKRKIYEVIFETNTPAGRGFDIFLIVAILLSVLVIMLDSLKSVRDIYETELHVLEWVFTIIFTIEYLMRLYCLDRPVKYMISFYGVVDLLSILPTLLSLVLPGSQYFASLRVLRFMRIFRILKLIQYVGEAEHLSMAMKASSKKIIVFISMILIFMIILGSVMYVVEGEANGFTSIPKSVYWAIVTMTTVGYGDISPQTTLGQFLASFVMLSGYAILAVPTGIISVEMSKIYKPKDLYRTHPCPGCGFETHDHDAVYCKKCSHLL